MRPARFPFARTTIPMDSPAVSSRITEPAPAPDLGPERLTEPLSLAHVRPVLPFRPAVVARASRDSEPSEQAPSRPALMPAERVPESSPPAAERNAVRVFCLAVVWAIPLGNVVLWLALALRPVPIPEPVTAPSLPASLLAALASTSTPIAEATSAAPAPESAPHAASSAPVRPRASTRPTGSPSRPSRGEIINPWGG